MLLFHPWRITAAEVRLRIALLCLLRRHYGILLFLPSSRMAARDRREKYREKDPRSGKMEARSLEAIQFPIPPSGEAYSDR